MEDRDNGSLDQKPVLDLIVELHANNVTGSLKLERPPLQKAVYFRDGQILFAASNDPKDQLASILVEEGKLGPDQMQVAQARVSPGNPLAKVLTELGYISQRELADAARIKVERILTDLYTWKEGTYQFATKSLPKGAIDLELSTPRLMFASIRRIQDRDWVLHQLGTLETVLSPASGLEAFLPQVGPDPQVAEVLRLVDGVKTIKQIGAVSSVGEFEVCKILAAGLVAGALERGNGVSAPDDAFVMPTEEPASSLPTIEASESIGNETVGLPTEPPPPEPPPPPPNVGADSEYEKTLFEPGSDQRPVFDSSDSVPGPERRSTVGASELIIDEPEPDLGPPSRTPPRPRRQRGGGGGSFDLKGILKVAAVLLLLAGAGYSVYAFVWPLVGGGGASRPSASTPAPGVSPTAEPTTSTPPPNAAQASPGGAASPPSVDAGAPAGATTPPQPGPQPAPAEPMAAPPPTTAPAPASTTTAAPRPAPAPPVAQPSRSGSRGRSLLASGDLPGAASAFLQELRSTGADKFTIAVGLYCNEANVERIVASASDMSQLYVLPTTVDGRRCYRVVWGLFDSRESAQSAMPRLPGAVRAGDAATMPLSQFLR